MSLESESKPLQIDLVPRMATDAEVAMFFWEHLENPCSVEVAPGHVENLREFYLREAKEAITKMTNPEAVQVLQGQIAKYTK